MAVQTAERSIKLQLTDKMAPFLFKNKRFKGAIGGRAGTKSQTIGDILLHKVSGEGIKVGCFREHQNTIEDSVHALLDEEITRLGFEGFNIGNNTIEHANRGKFRFRGLAKNTGGVLSMQGFDIFWSEESQYLSKKSLKLITPTLRTEGSEFWFSMNPMSRKDPMSERFIMPFIKELRRDGFYEDALHYIVWTNYDENPWFPDSLEQERKYDFEHLTRAEYDHVWRGHFNDSIENAIIKAEWFDACVDAHLKLDFEATGKRIVSHDPSDTGYDDKGLILRHGSVIEEALLNNIDDVNEGLDWALEFAVDNRADLFIWDADGMGLSLKRQVREYLQDEHIEYKMFRGSGGVERPTKPFEEDSEKELLKKFWEQQKPGQKKITNKQALRNLRAQKYWELRNRIYNTFLAVTKSAFKKQKPENLISFSSKITEFEQLRAEICKIPREPNPNGLIQIMSKIKMKSNEIDSPNLADPVMMSLLTPDIVYDDKPMVFTNPWAR